MRTSTWLDACRAFADKTGLAPELLEILATFRSPDPRGGPPPPLEPAFGGSFEALEAELGAIPERDIAELLRAEVDGDQARMFARRLTAVDEALGRFEGPSGRLLRVGLRVRARGILLAPGPRALRVRALADFYYSQLGRELHRREAGGPSTSELVARLEWRPVAGGLEHGRIFGPSADGPIHVNVLRVDPERVRIDAHDCRAAVRHGQPFDAHVQALGATAAVSGGFFLYSEPDIEAPSARFDPVGLLLANGQLLSPPVFRRAAVLVSERGRVDIARLGLDAVSPRVGAHALACAGAVTRAQARRGPAQPSVAIVGDRVVARGESLAVPLNGFVVPIPPALELPVGAAVDYGQVQGPRGQLLRAGIAGGPMLVEDGRRVLDMRGEDFWGSAPPLTFSQDETGDHNLLPRLAAGVDARGRLVLAAIDGRDFERALGMTLAAVGELMLMLGCERATNLDGGASKRMVVDGQTLDLSSTEIRARGSAPGEVRPVHTALLMFA